MYRSRSAVFSVVSLACLTPNDSALGAGTLYSPEVTALDDGTQPLRSLIEVSFQVVTLLASANSNPILVEQSPVRVQLVSTQAPTPHPSNQPNGARDYLVLKNVQTDGDPGVLFQLFLQTEAAGQRHSALAGTLSLFGIQGRGAGRSYTFEVTASLRKLEKSPRSSIDLLIEPIGQPASNAKVTIESVEVVRTLG